MENINLKQLKQTLLEMSDNILNELKKDRQTESWRDSSGDNSYSFHLADQGSDCNEQEKLYLIASMEGNVLKQLDEALVRIGDGSYGKCVLCGNIINSKKLEALPYAKLCIDCKSKKEKEMF